MAKTPSRAWLRASLLLWRRRERYRKARHDHWQRLVDRARRGDQHPRQSLIDNRDHWSRLLAQARESIALRERQLGPTGHATGIDVSSYQATVDWAAVKAAGYSFAWVKLTQGTSYVNPCASAQVRGARAHGLLVCGYHFVTAAPAAVQAGHFGKYLRENGLGRGDLLPVVDVEEDDVTLGQATAVIDAVDRELGVKPVLYTFPSFGGGRWPSTNGCKLWIAHFGVRRPTLPKPWTEYAAWQRDDKATVPGVSGYCDTNVTDHIEELIW